ncbi:MAG: hypothetical protein WA771_07555 [Chthoniobacterales bacterium]
MIKLSPVWTWIVVVGCVLGRLGAVPEGGSPGDPRTIPAPLATWEDWATWDLVHRECPTPYGDAEKHLCFWPSRLGLDLNETGGSFAIGVTAYGPTWVPLPGGDEHWPLGVTVGGVAVPVVVHHGAPSVQLAAGEHELAGRFDWAELPPSLRLPTAVGILDLRVGGAAVELPSWEADGRLWLKRDAASQEAERDFLSVKVYSLLEDGIPLWLRCEVELIVAGKSREEEIGGVLPEGWKLASVESEIPVAVDDAGRMKAQVRAGKWTVRLAAFRLDDVREFGFAEGVEPAVGDELVAVRAAPHFRMIDVVGAPSVDVSQTTIPDAWRQLPVYRWETDGPFTIEERMRGMGEQAAEGLTIGRTWWLDEDGAAMTFQDEIEGERQRIWRLDAAEGQDLGSVRSGGEGQLITRNPVNGAVGVEVRTRDLDLSATGRMDRTASLSATGWEADAGKVDVTLHLPPGWRLFALFGADWVRGDWLTAWTLLDLFLLLLFTLAVRKLWGWVPAAIAFLAFGISYHEPDAPRFLWLALLVPLALLRVVRPGEGLGRKLLMTWKWLAVGALVLALVPFVAGQVQQAIFPQLESGVFPGYGRAGAEVMVYEEASDALAPEPMDRTRSSWSKSGSKMELSAPGAPQEASKANRNLLYESKARIQTGPAVPDWTWRSVAFGWNGPVQASQEVRSILIPPLVERTLSILRVVLLASLALVLLRSGRWAWRGGRTVAIALVLMGWSSAVRAEFPDEAMLETLRERLTKPSEAYPHAADIPSASLELAGRRLTMEVTVHAAIETAVPLPGRLPTWSPVSVTVDGIGAASVRRDDGFLWVVVPAGVHTVRVEGTLSEAAEWQWTFGLVPRRVEIVAPDWNVTGVDKSGVPEAQVFFGLKQESTGDSASYDQQTLQTVAAVERDLELGLVWQVRTTVRRLSSEAKAVSLRVPLLPGENVISSNVTPEGGAVDVRLGAGDASFSWTSELTPSGSLALVTREGDPWVERWSLVVSQVWNVAFAGLAPTFEPESDQLVPVWRPWPGESVELGIERPEAIAGATVTVNDVNHEVELGRRQRVSSLDLSLRCSLGEDFLVGLPEGVAVTNLELDGRPLPVRMDGPKVMVPLSPGERAVSLSWKTEVGLGLTASAGEVTLPVESANVRTSVRVPNDRWTLWAHGPMRGPAVRFWVVLVCSVLAAALLARLPGSPLRTVDWVLLSIGLTQVPLLAALCVVAWLFLLAWRGGDAFQRLPAVGHNLVQIAIIGSTVVALGVLFTVVGTGLLGNPDMFVLGNGSSKWTFNWFLARSGMELPEPGVVTVSIWWYRLLMLGWALWLAAALIRWLRWGWEQFSRGGVLLVPIRPKSN